MEDLCSSLPGSHSLSSLRFSPSSVLDVYLARCLGTVCDLVRAAKSSEVCAVGEGTAAEAAPGSPPQKEGAAWVLSTGIPIALQERLMDLFVAA